MFQNPLVKQISRWHLHTLSDKNYQRKIELFKPIKALLKTMYASMHNYYHLFVKLLHCYNKICRSKALLAQPLLFPETMYIFFHHIRSWMVGEGQEWWGGGNATWEVVSVSKSKLLGDILQHNHPLCLCSSAHMAHIQPVTLNHCYFLTLTKTNLTFTSVCEVKCPFNSQSEHQKRH